MEKGINSGSLSNRGLTTENQIISQKERVDGWTAGPQADA